MEQMLSVHLRGACKIGVVLRGQACDVAGHLLLCEWVAPLMRDACGSDYVAEQYMCVVLVHDL